MFYAYLTQIEAEFVISNRIIIVLKVKVTIYYSVSTRIITIFHSFIMSNFSILYSFIMRSFISLQSNTIKIVTLFQAYTVTMFKPDYSGYYF